MSVRSHSRGSPAASSIRLALRTSSIVATRSASFVRWVSRWFGSRRLSSVLRLSAISVMPFMMRFQGPPRAEALNHTPIHQVNNLLARLRGLDHFRGFGPLKINELIKKVFTTARAGARAAEWSLERDLGIADQRESAEGACERQSDTFRLSWQ